MPAVTLYRLRPRGPMRFGTRGIALEEAAPFPSAATVFSAWCWALRDLAGVAALEQLLAAFRADTPPFLLAAPLPWLDDVLLLPRLALTPGAATPTDSTTAPRDKRGKRYRWVEEQLWFRLAAGADTTAEFNDSAAFHQEQTIWAPGATAQALAGHRERLAMRRAPDAAGTEPAFWRVATVPRVAVDRATNAGNIYHLTATWFAPGVDLALPVVWHEPAAQAALEQALVVLGETGIGGERSAGYGQFDVVASETRTRRWPDLADQAAFTTLAAYHPTRDEAQSGVFAAPAAYELELSRGWVERSTYYHAVRLVRAGSVLRRLRARAWYGELVDVTPAPRRHGHPVYRYGYAFPLPVTIQQGA